MDRSGFSLAANGYTQPAADDMLPDECEIIVERVDELDDPDAHLSVEEALADSISNSAKCAHAPSSLSILQSACDD